MKLIKCCYCGGSNEIPELNDGKLRCQYCKRWIVLPSPMDQEKQALYELGMQNMSLLRFREAEDCFRQLTEKDPENGDAFWKALLCHYGIVYVRDEATGQDKPTVTLLTETQILNHPYYIQAVKLTADEQMRKSYQEEAARVSRILDTYQKVSAAQKPYDVFISVKQSGEDGKPTKDSYEAGRLARFLESKGLTVFYSRTSLTGMIGQEYEPYIMAALLSARAMIVVASCRAYMEAPWVKNEWRRFRRLMENREPRRLLIPYLLGMSARDIPPDLGAMQCVEGTSLSAHADIYQAVRRVLPMKASEMQAPLCCPDSVTPDQYAYWLEITRVALNGYRDIQEQPLPDIRAAKQAISYIGTILNNLRRLKGYGDSGRLLEEAEEIHGVFGKQYERFRLEECAIRLEEISGRLEEGVSELADAASLQNELENLREEISGFSYAAAAEPALKKLTDLREKVGKTVRRLSPKTQVSDPLRSALAIGKGFIAGLNRDGKVLVEGKNAQMLFEAAQWRDIVSIAAGDSHLVGLKRDGSVVACGKNNKGQCDVLAWERIVSIAACGDHTVGLRADGTCVGAGNNRCGQLDVSGWRDIISLSTSPRHTLGCDSQGRAVAAGKAGARTTKVEGWMDVKAVFASKEYSVGLRKGGGAVVVSNSSRSALWLASALKKERVKSFAVAENGIVAILRENGGVRSLGNGGKSFLRALGLTFLFVCVCLGIGMYAMRAERPSNSLPFPSVARIAGDIYRKIGNNLYEVLIWAPWSIAAFLSWMPPLVLLTMKARLRLWRGITEIKADGKSNIYGLKADGSLVSTVKKEKLPQWRHIGIPDIEDIE